MKILLLGQHGQVSRELQLRLGKQDELTVLGREQLDLGNPQRIRECVRQVRPQLIVNAAAHTAVDAAQSEPDAAFAINAIAPGVLAEEAADLDAPLIHYSTDYVFDGSKSAAYNEDDAPNPLSVYGRSKLAGEQAIAAVGGKHLILRTSWVYSLHGRNFLLTMQRLLQEREQLSVVADQIGAPTWAGSIAAATQQLIQRWQTEQVAAWGLYHFTARGETSWFGFAEAIAVQLQAQGKSVAQLTPIATTDYPTPAQRPLNSRLDGTRLERDWGVRLPDWQDGLEHCLNNPR
ncbi:dTDP-4-dehydrorhamnose reductase [Pseudomonas daroniae]|uniref:dTDP-4-dehydrorhamnose reductase n=1 Tax=Phytopseudomonas daroniae TaxID=2487519 RepID=A0A4Q9QRR3_9GAMM|nr:MULTISPECIES: dTDP-4-dehydrorhamnose reductase [Pseudomonas]TBU83123.1 dTDP-4-dehydrorhamnose reductase [Pseudomonas sp. FRB 228]TBU83863.1 dTDP-4-dehydrorhamnose reductase [Pseudomonas daroniae]TBU93040.1 dTDP-4-dehydrorhamnose reductase [Pseudomonas daroniae]